MSDKIGESAAAALIKKYIDENSDPDVSVSINSSDLAESINLAFEMKFGSSDLSEVNRKATANALASIAASTSAINRANSLDIRLSALAAASMSGTSAYSDLVAQRDLALADSSFHQQAAGKYFGELFDVNNPSVKALGKLSNALGWAGYASDALEVLDLLKNDSPAAAALKAGDIALWELVVRGYGVSGAVALAVGQVMGTYGNSEYNTYESMVKYQIIDKYGFRIPKDWRRFPSIDEAQKRFDPIAIDLDGDGIETISLENGVYFNHDNNMFSEKTGWVSADDGLLVRDINGDGFIDNGGELFGNNTLLKNGLLANNGFEALKDLDDNKNGMLDSEDSVWQQLRVWQDKNGNGKVDNGELKTLVELKIKEISTGYTTSSAVDDNGNAHTQNSTITFADGTQGVSTDVWFDVNLADTQYNGNYIPTEDINKLPYLEGSGNLYNLHAAMSVNEQLKDLVERFVADPIAEKKSNLIEDILFCWAGVSEITPSIYGDKIDGRRVAFLEVVTGDVLISHNFDSNPGVIISLEEEYQKFYDFTLASMMIQTAYQEAFNLITFEKNQGNLVLNTAAFTEYLKKQEVDDIFNFLDIGRTFVGFTAYMENADPNIQKINSYINSYVTGTSGDETLYEQENLAQEYIFSSGHGNDVISNVSAGKKEDVLHFVNVKADLSYFTRQKNSLIIHAFGALDSVTIENYFMNGESKNSGTRDFSFEFDDITLTESDLATAGIPFYATEGNDRIDGWYGRDVLNGGAGDDYLYGGSGDDFLSGGTGDDSLIGWAGADVIDGGAGNDYLSGSTGLDTFMFAVGHGQDLIRDNSSSEAGNDTLRFTGAKADVGGFSREGNNLVIHAYGTADRVTIENYFLSGESKTSGFRNYSFEFDDITLRESDLATAGIPFYATAGDDRIDGWYGRDVLNGGVGNDFLYGGSGDDYISGGAGNDSLTGGAGADVIDGGAGNDRLGGTNGLDTFMFEVGHGQDVISDNSSSEAGNDTLRFTGAKADVGGFSREGNNLVIHAYGTADRVTIENYFLSGESKTSGFRNYSFEFDDTTLTESDLATAGIPFYATAGDDRIDGWYGRDVLNGGVGNDFLYGGSGDDYISGGAGNDSLTGGEGADVIDGGAGNDRLGGRTGLDTFMFEVGHGQDVISDNSSSEAGNDTLRFTGAKADVGGFSREGNNLVIHAYGTADRVTIENYFLSGESKTSGFRNYSFEFDDITLRESDLATALITFSGTDGNDNAQGWYGIDLMNGGGGNDSLSGGSGNDVLNGGVGNDSLYGGAGQDTYLFANGHGNDRVTDYAGKLEGKDIIEFSDLNLTDLWFSKSNSNLLITESGSQDSVEVINWYSNADSQNKIIHTHDGYEIDAAQVQQLVEAMSTFAATHSELSAADQQTGFMHSVSVSSYLEAAK